MLKTFAKSANLVVSGYSFLRSLLTGNAQISGMPLTVSVELTNHCNLKCPECFSGSGKMTRSKGFMDLQLFGKITDELKPSLLEMSLYFQGESMMHPDLESFLEKAKGIRTTLASNGHFLSPGNAKMLALSGLNKLIVSLDGMDQNTYSKYRTGGNIGIVTDGIRNISEAIKHHCSSLKLVIQFLVNRENEHQIPDVKRFAREMNASLKLKSMQIINEDSYEKWLPAGKRFRRYELRDNKYVLSAKLSGNCPRMWFNPVITWDGKVVPCCFDKDADHILGDINSKTFSEIWAGKQYKFFRKRVMDSREKIDMCRNCTTGLFSGIIS